MQNPTIRPLREHDAADLALMEAFFDQMGVETRAFFNLCDGNRRFMRESLSGTASEQAIHWVAESNGKVDGYVFLTQIDTGIPWLGIAVAEGMKGRHLGEALIGVAKEYATSHGKGGILLITHVANIRAQCLYEKCGFSRLGIHRSGEVLYCWRTTTAK